MLAKLRQTLTAQLSEVNKIGDSEAKERAFLLGKYRYHHAYYSLVLWTDVYVSGTWSMRLT